MIQFCSYYLLFINSNLSDLNTKFVRKKIPKGLPLNDEPGSDQELSDWA